MRKFIFILTLIALSCNSIEEKNTESEGNAEQKSTEQEMKLNEVRIDDQIWMDKNLNVDRFRNGDPIPQAKTKEEWAKAGEKKQPAWCYYENDPANGAKYGKLYNWYAVNDPRGLAPMGWHVPSKAEWNILTSYLGGPELAGIKMKSTTGWDENGNGNNESGFSGDPGGVFRFIGTDIVTGLRTYRFNFIGNLGYWWSTTEADVDNACNYCLDYGSGYLYTYCNSSKGNGLSVRCLRD